MIEAVRGLRGMVVLCGYPNALYTQMFGDFETFGTKSRIAAHRGTALRDERVWLNPACSAALAQQSLFV